jgi:hypothetical protein
VLAVLLHVPEVVVTSAQTVVLAAVLPETPFTVI